MTMIRLATPLAEAAIRSLRVGDEVLLSGRVVLSRDLGHKYMVEHKPEWLEPILRDAVVYHCGPVVKQDEEGRWTFVAAGPTTSIREEPYQGEVIRKCGVRAIIGKGGMGAATQAACVRFGCVYLQAVGGAAALLAQRIRRVAGVSFLEAFGATEALWQLEVEGFEAVVGMDAHGRNLFDDVRASSAAELRRLLRGGA